MPSVEPGDTVVLLSSPDDTHGHIVMVNQVNEGSINVTRLGTSLQALVAIRHRADPILEANPDMIQESGGCWEESSKMIRMREIEKALTEMAREIGALRAAVKGRKQDGGGK